MAGGGLLGLSGWPADPPTVCTLYLPVEQSLPSCTFLYPPLQPFLYLSGTSGRYRKVQEAVQEGTGRYRKVQEGTDCCTGRYRKVQESTDCYTGKYRNTGKVQKSKENIQSFTNVRDCLQKKYKQILKCTRTNTNEQERKVTCVIERVVQTFTNPRPA